MWRTANPIKIAACRGYGAEVDLESEGPAEAHHRLLAFVEETGATFVHPFDDPVLQAGYGAISLEILEDAPETTTIVVPIAGGGLIAGIASAAGCRVVGVEPELAPTMARALEAGRPVEIQPRSIADGLGAPFTGEHTLSVVRDRVADVVLVTEDEIKDAMRFLYGSREARVRAGRRDVDGRVARRQDRARPGRDGGRRRVRRQR